MGLRKGVTASCALAGYVWGSACHTRMNCVYDIMRDFGWRSSIMTHGIDAVIQNVIMEYVSVPVCKPSPECHDWVVRL